MKLDGDMLSTVPDDPPAAGPDRALEPPPPATPLPDPKRPDGAEEEVAVVEEEVVAEEDAAQAAQRPNTAHISPAAAIRLLALLESNRPTVSRRACLAVVTEADESGQDACGGGGAAPAPPELPATGGPDVALETGRAGTLSRGLVGS